MLNLHDESETKYTMSVHRMKALMQNSSNLQDLRHIHDEIIQFIKELERADQSVGQMYSLIDQAHEYITKNAVDLAFKETNKYLDPPGGSYCFFNMGSSARQEQTIWTDQDNGIIFQNLDSHSRGMDSFMETFAQNAVQNLSEVGYPLCQGNVMASNLRWRHCSEEWKSVMNVYLESEDDQDLKYVMIMLDTKPVFGAPSLLMKLRTWLLQEIMERPSLVKRMIHLVTSQEVPINMFGMIFTERYGQYAGRLDIKQGVFAPFTNSIKMFSLLYGGQFQTTRERLIHLDRQKAFSPVFIEELYAVYEFLLLLRLNHSVQLSETDDKLDYHVAIHQNRTNARQLKNAMKVTKNLQKMLKKRGLSFERSTRI